MTNTPNQLQYHSTLRYSLGIIGMALALAGCGDTSQTSDPTPESEVDKVLPQLDKTDQNSQMDLVCVQNIVGEAWHDDPDLDMATILAKSTDEFSQASIDVVIDIAVEVNNKCANQRN